MREMLKRDTGIVHHVRGERGFTLIELLIVIVVIGILAGIAIFAFEPFQDEATEARDQANQRIDASAEAAAGASEALGSNRDASDFIETPGSTGGGGGGGDETFVTSEVQSAEAVGGGDSASVTLGAAPTEGNTLVAISAHRTTADDGNATLSGSGWSLADYEHSESSSGDRRGLGVWTKTAGASEPTTIDVTWAPDDGSGDVTLIVREFDQDLSVADVDSTNSGTDEVDSLSTGTVSGSSGSGLIVTAVGMREGASDFSWTNGVGGNVDVSEATTSASGFASVNDGAQSFESEASWTSAQYANAMILLLQ